MKSVKLLGGCVIQLTHHEFTHQTRCCFNARPPPMTLIHYQTIIGSMCAGYEHADVDGHYEHRPNLWKCIVNL